MWHYYVELDASHPDGPSVCTMFNTCVGETKKEVKDEMICWLEELSEAGFTVISMTSRLTNRSNGNEEPK